MTNGIAPAIVFVSAARRRGRLIRYFEHGIPAIAEITAIDIEMNELGTRHGRVRFQYETEGQLHRGSDTAPIVVADKWRPGDQIEILYLPDDDYDAVIISTR